MAVCETAARAFVAAARRCFVPPAVPALLMACATPVAGPMATASGPPASAQAGAPLHAAPQPRTVELVLDGRRTVADVFVPPGVALGGAVLAHGFTRTRATMTGHAALLANAGILAVTPDLPYLIDSRDNARALADLVAQMRAGRFAAPVDHLVLIGFSAGGLAALLASDRPGVVGYVGMDPFDRPSRIGHKFAQTLPVPAALLRAPASACNAFSIAAPWAQAFPRIEVDRLFEGATHCDFEAPSDWLCRTVCGPEQPERQGAIGAELLRIVRKWLVPVQVATPG